MDNCVNNSDLDDLTLKPLVFSIVNAYFGGQMRVIMYLFCILVPEIFEGVSSSVPTAF